MVIILGTAHGSNVAGKCSPDKKLLEYKYSREIVSKVEAELVSKGYTVFVDVKTEVEPSLTYRVNQVNKICATYGKDNCLYVSIHVNGAGNQGKWLNANYWTVWTSKGQTKGDKLAASIYNAAKEVLKGMKVQGEYSDGDPDYEANFYVLRKTRCAACLTENFFQDNKDSVNFLLSEEGKSKIVELHVKGIIDYIKGID